MKYLSGQTGQNLKMREQERVLHGKTALMNGRVEKLTQKKKEVFDVELYAVDRALDVVLQGGRSRGRVDSRATKTFLDFVKIVPIWLDSRAVIQRLPHLGPGPGQWLAHRIQKRIEELKNHNITVYIHCVPGHVGIEGDERADRAAKKAAGRRLCPRERLT